MIIHFESLCCCIANVMFLIHKDFEAIVIFLIEVHVVSLVSILAKIH